jgi:VCBS repeat protein/PPIC-type peptidyl-prolyl cis-trans isomerase-like protein/ASPIC/UnbV protein
MDLSPMRLRRWNTAIFPLWLIASTSALFVPSAHPQQDKRSQETYVGMIVTRTAEEAQAVLNELKAGMDFGVLAKEKSIDPTSNDGGYVGGLSSAQLSPALTDALKGVRSGGFTRIVHIPTGYAILTILSAAPKVQDLNAKQIQDLATSVVVRQSINVAGMSEEDSVFAQYPKPDNWKQDLSEPCVIRKQSHPAAVERMEQLLRVEAKPGSKSAPIDLMRGHIALAQLHTFVGDMDRSIKEWLSAYQIAQSDVHGAIPYLQEALGVSYLHLSEMENGIYRDSGSMDIFPPLNPDAHFEKPENSKLAIQYFQSFLELAPNDLQVRWLLNLAYRTVGEYPAGVPARYLISPDYFESKESVGRFTDVARSAGLNVFAAAGGVIVDDFENNGLLDVITSSVDMCDPLHYFHNNGDGTFTDRTVQAGLSKQLGGLNLIQADYNNDGCMDFLVLRGGWEFPIRKSLLRNNCDGTFTDVTQKSGLGEAFAATQTAAWADIDNDGYLDLFVGNENAPSQLFRNRGDGTFEDISHAAGIDKTAITKGVAAADYDKDGYVDFYVSNYGGANFLYHNNHNLTFTDVAKQAGVEAPYISFATWFFDYDNDGWPDLFVTSYYSFTVDQVMRSYLGLPVTAETLKLYRNLHNGTFQDVTAQVGLDKVFMPMGANFGDVDNDGFLDIYLGMGQPSLADMMPHVLLRNKEGKAFVDITASSGTGELHKGHGIAFADLERNGHEDIVAEIGGSVPSDKHTMRVFRNPGDDNDWVNVRLTGVKSNRAALGAEIKVTVENDGGVRRSIYRTVGDTSSFGANPMEQHIGLGHGARIIRLDVWWPASNTRQQFSNVDKNEFIAIKEFDTRYTKLERKPFRMGGSKTVGAVN